MGKVLLIGLCIFALLHLHSADAKSGLRSRRYVEDYDGNSEDYDVGEVDSNELRESRQASSTFPPFPGDDSWWYQDPAESEGNASPPPPVIEEKPEAYTYNPREEEETKVEESPRENESKPLHKKIGHWFKKQYGHTKSFFKNLG